MLRPGIAPVRWRVAGCFSVVCRACAWSLLIGRWSGVCETAIIGVCVFKPVVPTLGLIRGGTSVRRGGASVHVGWKRAFVPCLRLALLPLRAGTFILTRFIGQVRRSRQIGLQDIFNDHRDQTAVVLLYFDQLGQNLAIDHLAGSVRGFNSGAHAR